MDTPFHRICDLFAQLGLDSDPPAVERFIASHRPLPDNVRLADAAFWTPAQAQFLREQLSADADWSPVVDSLAARLQG